MWQAKNWETKMEPKSEQDWKWKSILDAAITNSEMDRWETAVAHPDMRMIRHDFTKTWWVKIWSTWAAPFTSILHCQNSVALPRTHPIHKKEYSLHPLQKTRKEIASSPFCNLACTSCFLRHRGTLQKSEIYDMEGGLWWRYWVCNAPNCTICCQINVTSTTIKQIKSENYINGTLHATHDLYRKNDVVAYFKLPSRTFDAFRRSMFPPLGGTLTFLEMSSSISCVTETL